MLLPLKSGFIKEPFKLKLSFKNELKYFLFVSSLIAVILFLINPIKGSGNKILLFLGFFITGFVAFIINSLYNFYLIPYLSDLSKWSIGEEILRRVCNLFVFTALIYLYYSWVFKVNLELTIKFFFLTLIFGLIAITYRLNAERSDHLKQTQDILWGSNALLNKELGAIKKSQLSFISNVTKETLNVDKNQLLFIEAYGNYTIFNITKNNKIETIVFRCNLKNIEKQLDNTHLIRCHRSYIINLANSIKFKRKANNIIYAKIDCHDFKIPISRVQYKIVKESYERVKANPFKKDLKPVT